MFRVRLRTLLTVWRARARLVTLTGGLLLLAACASGGDIFGTSPAPAVQPQQAQAPAAGQIKVALILPLSASGNAGVAATSMRNAAEMALQEFNAQNIQLLVKDDFGTPSGAQQAAQQALDEGAEIVLGPLFAQSVQAAAQVTRARNVPMIAFSTDASVASRGVYLLSFLPESDVNRVISYAFANGKRSLVAMLPDNAYGSVVEAAMQQAVSRRGGRVVGLERYPVPPDKLKMQDPAKSIAQSSAHADALFIPDGADAVPLVVQTLGAQGMTKRLQLLGTGLWDNSRIFADQALQGAWYAGPDIAGYNAFAGRYKAKYGQEPVRTATLAYDAAALVAALVKTQGTARFTDEVLTNASGFAGIDGIFRFRPDGTNERGLAILKVTSDGPQVVSPAPKTFGGSGT
ncbi:MAG TPA: penicillin-binding protein activator [Pseudorhodoplanes sp.]|jgi:ABC-type branched-subunit amino acid transport system substrate-binding protein|nr:penicillin-binding protein activator [Pseudorhodoplanes sp.]